MDLIKDSSPETENSSKSMEWEDDKEIEKPDASVDEDRRTTDDPNLISEDATSQPSTSRGSGLKRKSYCSGPQPKKIPRKTLDEKQEHEHLAVQETKKYEIDDVASSISLSQTIPEKTRLQTIWETEDFSSQGTSGIMPANLPSDDFDRSEDVSADSRDNIGDISGQASTSRSSQHHDVETDMVFRHPGVQGLKTISKRRRSESEEHPSILKLRRSDSEGHSSDSEGHPSIPKLLRSDSEGHSSDSKGRMSESDGHSSDSKGRMSESDGHSSDSKGRMSDSEGHSSDPDGGQSDTKGHSTDPERRRSDAEGHSTDPERRQSDPDRRQSDAEGHSSDRERRQSDAERPSSLDFSSEFSTYFGDRFQRALEHLFEHGITGIETESEILNHFRRQRPENHLRCLICEEVIRRKPPKTSILMSSSESDNE